jgi:alkylation response protein AidB-like acyl-CoA dehydrogenase
VKPNVEKWEQAGIVHRNLFHKGGKAGFLGMAVPEQFGGSGVADFRFNAIMAEELSRAHVGASGDGILLHNDNWLPSLLSAANEEQKSRWLPGMCSGELDLAIAMTEPGAGSDLASIRTTARREGDHYVATGQRCSSLTGQRRSGDFGLQNESRGPAQGNKPAHGGGWY